MIRSILFLWARALLLAAAVTAGSASVLSAQVRIKDIASFEGVRENHLIGYGLVVGLQGTGDGLNASPFTRESITGMLERLGVANLRGARLNTKNTAAVMVTANLPPFARRGAQIDVAVSSLGDATDLRGGTLLVTPLTGADGEIYAVAQGAIATSGFLAQGNAASIVQGVPTTARLENGAIVEREVGFELGQLGSFRIALNEPDFTTASRVRDAVDVILGPGSAEVKDPGTVEVLISEKGELVNAMAAIENQPVRPDTIARVVVDDKSGTIVIGANVRVGQVAVSQGGLTVTIDESFAVSQPEPFSLNGRTVVIPETDIEVEEREGGFSILQGEVSLQELVNGLNAIGVTARQTISILQAIKAAGALHAHLEII